MPAGETKPVSELVPVLADRLPAILTEVEAALREFYPGYADFLHGELDDVVNAASGFAAQLIEQADDPSGPVGRELGEPERTLFEEIGRGHHQDGHSVDGLLATYRIGAAVAWRHIVADARCLAVPTQRLLSIATALFTAVDQLSSASLRGYLDSESHSAGDRLSERLAEMLLSARADSVAVAALAARVGWSLPTRAALVLMPVGPHAAGRDRRDVLGKLSRSVHLYRHDTLIVVVPDPDGPGRRQWLSSTLRGCGAVISPTTGLYRLPGSLPVAELALRLRRHGTLSADPVFVVEHLDALIVHHDQALLAALRHQVLAPLDGLDGLTRQRLETTLRSWLDQMGNQRATAAELHIHPQTVRYRLARLRELFGARLDDPAERTKLFLTLHWDPRPAGISRTVRQAGGTGSASRRGSGPPG